MSTKPVTEPNWDTNLTNVSAVTAGHKTDGFAFSEIPTSGELNTHLNFLYVWIHWLAAQCDDVITLPQTITRESYTSGLITAHAVLTTGTTLKLPVLGLRKNDKIIAIRARGVDAAGPPVAHTVTATGLSITVADLTDYVLVMTESGGALFGVQLFSVADGTASGALASSPTVSAPSQITLWSCSVDVQRAAA